MSTSTDHQPCEIRPETAGIAAVLAAHGVDPQHDSRFHRRRSRVEAGNVGIIVHAGLGLTMALVAASAGGGAALSWFVAAAAGVAALWASLRLRGDDTGASGVETVLAVAIGSALALLSGEGAARVDGVAPTPTALVCAFIAAGGAVLAASALLAGSAGLRLQARILVPVAALAAVLAVA